MRVPLLASIFAIGFLLCAASCSSSDDTATSPAPAQEAGAATDAGDAGIHLDATCDAKIVECVTTPTQPSPTVNDPAACGAPAYDSYATAGNNEQVEAACNDFCVAQNPAYADAGSAFVGCNQTAAEQALGTGAFHCVCAP